MKRFALALLILVQRLSPVGCNPDVHKEGYKAGLAAGAESNTAESEPVLDIPQEYEGQGFALITDMIPDAILEIRCPTFFLLANASMPMRYPWPI